MVATDNTNLRHGRRMWLRMFGQGKRLWAVWSERGAIVWRWILRRISAILPKGLYTRALIIIIAPIVLLEGVVA